MGAFFKSAAHPVSAVFECIAGVVGSPFGVVCCAAKKLFGLNGGQRRGGESGGNRREKQQVAGHG
jgi:hypothetical protein